MDDRRIANWVGGVAIALILATMGWLLVSRGSGATGGQNALGDAVAGQPSPTTAAHHRTADQLQGCLDTATAMQVPLRRASASVTQWEARVRTMNKLVAGTITSQQATAVFKRTQVRTDQQLADFHRAWVQLKSHHARCLSPAQLPSGTSAQQLSCARQVADQKRALQDARVAIDTWRRQVQVMNKLRQGNLSPSTANQMWLRTRHRSQQEIRAYRVAARAARSTPGCQSAPSAPSLLTVLTASLSASPSVSASSSPSGPPSPSGRHPRRRRWHRPGRSRRQLRSRRRGRLLRCRRLPRGPQRRRHPRRPRPPRPPRRPRPPRPPRPPSRHPCESRASSTALSHARREEPGAPVDRRPRATPPQGRGLTDGRAGVRYPRARTNRIGLPQR